MTDADGRARGLARLILASRAVDDAYRAFDRVRSRLVVSWASDDVLAAYNALAYQKDEAYVPGSDRFRRHLFPWENAAVSRYFPAPPARLLVGGAGGGRETFALADRGYEIVAFEPAAGLAAAAAARAHGNGVRFFRAAYEDLPTLRGARPEDPDDRLDGLGPFSGAVMGWGSFSHLLTEERRIDALRSLAAVVQGPILVSFLAFRRGDRYTPSPGQSRRGVRRGDTFSAHIGFYHVSNPPELDALASAAGLRVESLDADESEASWPHAVLSRAERGARDRSQPNGTGSSSP